MTVAAVVLAAGGGSRFTGEVHKLRSLLDGLPVVHRALTAACEAELDEVIVVSGAVEVSDLVPAGVTEVHNAQWADGIATSLAAAIDYATDRGHDAIVVGLGDQPFVTAAAWRLVAEHETTPIVAASYGGVRRNPVRLAKSVWPLLDRTGDDGARTLMQRRPDLVSEVACPGTPVDVDTVEDLAKWN